MGKVEKAEGRHPPLQRRAGNECKGASRRATADDTWLFRPAATLPPMVAAKDNVNIEEDN